jgi:hypothetical protein
MWPGRLRKCDAGYFRNVYGPPCFFRASFIDQELVRAGQNCSITCGGDSDTPYAKLSLTSNRRNAGKSKGWGIVEFENGEQVAPPLNSPANHGSQRFGKFSCIVLRLEASVK